jgi:phosphate transport system protein
MASHYELTMQRDAERIRSKVEQMSALASDALDACLRAYLERNRLLAYTVILRDRRIDELEKEVDRLCLEFIVRHQPAGKHLRFAYVALRINLELERIGDYAESIARQIVKLSNIEMALPMERIRQIAGVSIPMLRDAVRAFATEDEPLARKTIQVEDEVDGLKSISNAEILRSQQEQVIPIEALNPLLTIVRRFERVSDQARNICEEAIYFITGEYQKHLGNDVWRMVFVDQDNACLSQMAEAIANSLGHSKFVFASAGMEPTAVDPETIAYLRTKEIDISKATTRSINRVPNLEFTQVLVALTRDARKVFPNPSRAVCLDWTIQDPSKVQGTSQERRKAYDDAFNFLYQHISDICEAVLSDKID